MVSADRTYYRAMYARSWHGLRDYEHVDPDRITVYLRSICGRLVALADADTADRLPPTAHLCGNCARVIAARTDVEA